MTEVLNGDETARVTTGLKPPKYSIPGSSEQTHRLDRAPQSRPQRRWRDSTPLPSPAPRIQDPTHWGCISPKPVYRAEYLQNPFIEPRNKHHQCTFSGTPRGQKQEDRPAPPQPAQATRSATVKHAHLIPVPGYCPTVMTAAQQQLVQRTE